LWDIAKVLGFAAAFALLHNGIDALLIAREERRAERERREHREERSAPARRR